MVKERPHAAPHGCPISFFKSYLKGVAGRLASECAPGGAGCRARRAALRRAILGLSTRSRRGSSSGCNGASWKACVTALRSEVARVFGVERAKEAFLQTLTCHTSGTPGPEAELQLPRGSRTSSPAAPLLAAEEGGKRARCPGPSPRVVGPTGAAGNAAAAAPTLRPRRGATAHDEADDGDADDEGSDEELARVPGMTGAWVPPARPRGKKPRRRDVDVVPREACASAAHGSWDAEEACPSGVWATAEERVAPPPPPPPLPPPGLVPVSQASQREERSGCA